MVNDYLPIGVRVESDPVKIKHEMINIFYRYKLASFCVTCEAWSTHRDHDPDGVVVVRVVTFFDF